jgi:Zn/Cd-binding protein ZinT
MIQLAIRLLILGSFKVLKANKDGSKQITSPKAYITDQLGYGTPTNIAILDNDTLFFVAFSDGSVKFYQYNNISRLYYKTHDIPILKIQASNAPIKYFFVLFT